MQKNWKIALASGAAAGLALGGFGLASADESPRPVDPVIVDPSPVSPVSPAAIAVMNDGVIDSVPAPIAEVPAPELIPAPAPAPEELETFDSPVVTPPPAPAPQEFDSFDSPVVTPPPAPAPQEFDSIDSPDTPVDRADASVDAADVSFDSP